MRWTICEAKNLWLELRFFIHMLNYVDVLNDSCCFLTKLITTLLRNWKKSTLEVLGHSKKHILVDEFLFSCLVNWRFYHHKHHHHHQQHHHHHHQQHHHHHHHHPKETTHVCNFQCFLLLVSPRLWDLYIPKKIFVDARLWGGLECKTNKPCLPKWFSET